MLLKKYGLSLDIKREKAMHAPVMEFVQDDTGTCALDISIREMNDPVDLSDVNVEIVFAKPDGTTVIQDLANGVNITDAANGKITCTLKTNTIAAAGKVHAEVRLLAGEKLLTTPRFAFDVRKALLNDEVIESMDEVPILRQLIADVQNVEGKEGPQGEPGPAGASAYDLWLTQGNTGTVDDFLHNITLGAQGPNIYPTPLTWSSLDPGQSGVEILEQIQHGGQVLKMWQAWTWLAGVTTAELIPGELYQASYYARKDGTQFSNVEARFIIPRDTGGSYDYVLGSENGTREITNDWQWFTTEFRWQGENERHRVYVQTNEANIDNPVYFAGPSLRRINKPKDYILNRLRGKSIYFTGDSWASENAVYLDRLKSLLDLASIQGDGISSSTISKRLGEEPIKSLVTRVDEGEFDDLSTYDLLCITGGVNDWSSGVPIGNAGKDTPDISTLCGAVEYVTKQIKSKNPELEVIWVIQPYLESTTPIQVPFEGHRQGIISSCLHVGCQYIDTQRFMGFTRENIGIYTNQNHLHLNSMGGDKYAQLLALWLVLGGMGGTTPKLDDGGWEEIASVTVTTEGTSYLAVNRDKKNNTFSLKEFEVKIIFPDGVSGTTSSSSANFTLSGIASENYYLDGTQATVLRAPMRDTYSGTIIKGTSAGTNIIGEFMAATIHAGTSANIRQALFIKGTQNPQTCTGITITYATPTLPIGTQVIISGMRM